LLFYFYEVGQAGQQERKRPASLEHREGSLRVGGDQVSLHPRQPKMLPCLMHHGKQVLPQLSRLFIYGGYDNNTHGILKDMFAFTFGSNTWEALKQNGELPGSRHSQTVIVYQEKIYMFGGMYDIMNNTNVLHVYDVESATWGIKKT
jgi:hypothetical protein